MKEDLAMKKALVLILAFVALGTVTLARAQPPDATYFATAIVYDAAGHGTYVGANSVTSPAFTLPPSLSTAAYRTPTMDLTWTATATEQPLPRGQLKQYEDCSATVAQSLTRDAVVSGTLNGVPVAGTGIIGRYFYAPGASSLPHC